MTAAAVLIVAAAGILSGLYTTPMRFIEGWHWQHTWLIYTTWGAGILPWVNAFPTCSNIVDVYRATESKVFLEVIGLSLLWGIGSSLFGLAVKSVGNSLAFAIILGLSSTFGAALPLLIFNIQEATQKVGIYTWVSLAIVAIGLVFLAYAGVLRDRDQRALALEGTVAEGEPISETSALIQHEDESAGKTHDTTSSNTSNTTKSTFLVGLLYCLFSGIFSACLNVALAFGSPITDKAVCVSSSVVQNALWPIAVSGGMIVNTIYCGYINTIEGTWHYLWRSPHLFKNHFVCFIMGLLWFEANVIYGVGSALLGSLGLVLGWPVYMSAMILIANASAVLQGEWKGTRRPARIYMAIGVAIIIVAIIVVALA